MVSDEEWSKAEAQLDALKQQSLQAYDNGDLDKAKALFEKSWSLVQSLIDKAYANSGTLEPPRCNPGERG